MTKRGPKPRLPPTEIVGQCPHCKKYGSGVKYTRPQKTTGFLRRLRYCLSCKRTWSTIEVPLSYKTRLMDVEKLFAKMRAV